MTNEECKAILDKIIQMWYDRCLEIMVAEPWPSFEEALEQVKVEMKND